MGGVSVLALLVGSTTVVLAAFLLFALARGHLAEPVLATSVRGVGVGAFSAAIPAIILAAHTINVFPQESGYTTTAWTSVATTIIALLIIVCGSPRQLSGQTSSEMCSSAGASGLLR